MYSFIVFDPKMVVYKDAPQDAGSTGALVAKPGEPEILTSHIIPITQDGTVELAVYRLLPNGNIATTPGFREERDPEKATAEAAAGKLVICLGTPW